MSTAPVLQETNPPAEVARILVEQMGFKKTAQTLAQTMALGILAGVFIAIGALYYTMVMTESGLGFGLSRMLGGIAFSLGLILVVIAGAELFTGNNLMILAWAEQKVTTSQMLRNWGLVYLANVLGAFVTAGLVWWAGTLALGDGAVGRSAAGIAHAKVSLQFSEAFVRGMLCNMLVCLAVWLCVAARDVTSKIVALIFPISAFVALGFEHSIANAYLIPVAWLHGAESVTLAGFVGNIVPVTLGNIVGGCVFVGAAYWLAYLRKPQSIHSLTPAKSATWYTF